MEDYAAKMQLKPDAALREYVTNYQQYREAAVLAAFDELRRRGQPAPEEAGLRPGLEMAAEKQRLLDEAAEAERLREKPVPAAADADAGTDDEDEPAGPAVYSPGTIVLFSVLFSMLAGGILLSINLRTVGARKGLVRLWVFIAGYLIVGGGLLYWLVKHNLINRMALSLFDLPAILMFMLWFWPRYLGAPGEYRSRNWLVPFLICGVLKVVLALGVIQMTMGMDAFQKLMTP